MRGKNLTLMSMVFIMAFGMFMTGPGMSDPATRIYIDPPSMAPELDELITVNLMIADVSQLYTWSLRLEWDPGILAPDSATEGPFLKDVAPGTLWIKKIFPSKGYMDLGCTATGAFSGASGSGRLATIKFTVSDIGSTPLDLKLSLLLKPIPPGGGTAEPIPHTAEDGFVDVHSDWLLRPDFYVELVEKKVSDRHWDMSVKGYEFTFFGKGKNHYAEPLWIRVLFTGMKDGEPFKVVTDSILVDPGQNSPPFLTFLMFLDPSVDIGEYVLQVYAQFSYRGFKWYTDSHKAKDISFVIQE